MIRCVGLQTAGSGGCLRQWGSWWGKALAELGADIGVLTETRIGSEHQHTQAVAGMLEAGYIAVSHNASDLHRETDVATGAAAGLHGPRAAGVILAVKRSYVGGWSSVAFGPLGRALAGTLVLEDGASLRVLGLYGVTGACNTNFLSLPSSVIAEQRVNAFVQDQAALCEDKGWHMVAIGDLNSLADAHLDRIGGRSAVRPECLAAQLAELGLRDSFRVRHPDLRAVTFVSWTGSASRLDQIRFRSVPGDYI